MRVSINLFLILFIFIVAAFYSCKEDDDKNKLQLETSELTINEWMTASLAVKGGTGSYTATVENKDIVESLGWQGSFFVFQGKKRGSTVIDISDGKKTLRVTAHVAQNKQHYLIKENKAFVECDSPELAATIKSEVESSFPFQPGHHYLLEFETPTTGKLTIGASNGNSKIIEGTFVCEDQFKYVFKYEGTQVTYEVYDPLSRAILTQRIRILSEDLTDEYSSRYPDNYIQAVSRNHECFFN